MALANIIFAHYALKNDRKRDEGKVLPNDIREWKDLSYSPDDGVWGMLDVYRPDREGVFPLIVVVHGGAFIYGTKEIYSRYAKTLAHEGYVVACYNYPLAPNKRFPYQLKSLDMLMAFLKERSGEFAFDPAHVYLYGDSAGASLSLQYAIIMNNEEYRKLFPELKLPLPISGLSLNCGLYEDLGSSGGTNEFMMWRNYLPRHRDKDDPRFKIVENITSSLPPCFVMTSDGDFLLPGNAPLIKKLKEEKVPYLYVEQKGKEKPLGHVFHLDVDTDDAVEVRRKSQQFLSKF